MIALKINPICGNLFTQNQKCYGAAIAGAAAATNTLINLAGQAYLGSNSTRKQLRHNKELLDYQNAVNVENWKMENEYNLPKNQVQRLRDAGINPALALSGIEQGGASIDGTSQPGWTEPNYAGEALAKFSDGMTQAVRQYYDVKSIESSIDKTQQEARKAELEGDNQEIINEYTAQQQVAQLNKMIAETEKDIQEAAKAGRETEQLTEMLSLLKAQRQDLIDKAHYDAQYQKELVNGQKIQNDINQIHLDNLPQKYQLEFREAISRIGLNIANQHLSEAQASLAVTQEMESLERQWGIRIDNEIKAETKNYAVACTNATNKEQYYRAQTGILSGDNAITAAAGVGQALRKQAGSLFNSLDRGIARKDKNEMIDNAIGYCDRAFSQDRMLDSHDEENLRKILRSRIAAKNVVAAYKKFYYSQAYQSK